MKLTWYGHAAFKIEIEGASILIDPFLSGNPSFPSDLSVAEVSEGVTHVLLTHGHDDHIGDSIDILKKTGAQLTANPEICGWAGSKGVEKVNPMNSGGCVDLGPFKVALTVAHHSSSSSADGGITYLGNPHGIVIDAPNEKTFYHMGDTDVFSDMSLINELYAPKLAVVPIGDRFTMGAKAAALACNRFFDFETIVPCHYGTFPLLDQTADGFLKEMGANASRVSVATPGTTFEA